MKSKLRWIAKPSNGDPTVLEPSFHPEMEANGRLICPRRRWRADIQSLGGVIMPSTVRKLIRLAITQLRAIDQLYEAGRTGEVAEQWKGLRATMVELLDKLGLKKEK